MKNLLVVGAVGAALLFAGTDLSATPTPVSLFSQCPQVGCSYVLVLGTQGSISLLTNPNAKDSDGKENIFVGIQNSSGHYIDLAPLSGPNGPFPGLQLTGGLWDKNYVYFEMKDPFERHNGKNDGDDDDKVQITPEPSSIALLGGGFLALGAVLRRRLRS